MTATAVDERSLLPSPTWPPSAPAASFPLTDPVALADGPCQARFSGADSEYAGNYLHARYFDPKLGIFLSPDPIGVEGGMNLYGYGSGDPINNTDRSGLSSCGNEEVGADTPQTQPCVEGPKAIPGGLDPLSLIRLINQGRNYFGWAKRLYGFFFGSHSHNAPWDPRVPQPTAYVRGKPIDPYSDEEPSGNSLVSLVPDSGGSVAGGGVDDGGGTGGEEAGGEGGGSAWQRAYQEQRRNAPWNWYDSATREAMDIFPNPEHGPERDRQRHCWYSCITLRRQGPAFAPWMPWETVRKPGKALWLLIRLRDPREPLGDYAADWWGVLSWPAISRTCEELCGSCPANK